MLLWFTIGLVLAAIFLFSLGAAGLYAAYDDDDFGYFLAGAFFLWVSVGCFIWAYNLWS